MTPDGVLTADTRGVIAEFWARHRARDPRVADLFAEETDFHAPGDPRLFPWAGTHTRGGRALLWVFEAMWAANSPGSSKAETTLIVEGEHAVRFAHGLVHRLPDADGNPGRPVVMDVAIHFTVRDGKITRFRVIEDVSEMMRLYGFEPGPSS